MSLIAEDLNIPVEFNVVKSWQEVITSGLATPNTIIAGIGCTAKRENLFYWIGPVNYPTDINIYAIRGSKINITSIDDLGSYYTAVQEHMYYHDFMVHHGFGEKTLAVVNVESMIKLLRSGKADLILMEQDWMESEFKQLGLDPFIVENKGVAFRAQTFLSLSKSSDAYLYQRLKESYDKLTRKGLIRIK